MRLRVGLMVRTPTWEQICRQEGVPFGRVSLESAPLRDQCSVLVVNRPVSRDEREAFMDFLKAGGAVLGWARHLAGVAGTTARSERLEYLVANKGEKNYGVSLLDLAVEGDVPGEANALRTQADGYAMFAGPIAGGFAVILPFDVEDALNDARSVNKNFYFHTERLPSEQVSLAGKGEVRQLLHAAFAYLHHAQGLPYAHLGYYPADTRSIFAFRLDTDKSSRADIEAQYALAEQHAMGLTWFLDAKSHEGWLAHFTFMAGQEIGLHCYEHQVYASYEDNFSNIAKGKHLLEATGLKPEGFAAPYGTWNPEIARAVDALGFAYSSEFSYAYDTLPLFPRSGGAASNVLQVPVHPICIGSLRKAGFTEVRMKEYFRAVIDQKLLRQEPLFFYHHPVHRCWDVVRDMFDYVQERGIGNTTLGEYARWWKRRNAVEWTVETSGDELRCSLADPNPEQGGAGLWLQVTDSAGREATVPFAERVSLSALQPGADPVFSPPADIRRIREFDPRRLLGDVITTMSRRLR